MHSWFIKNTIKHQERGGNTNREPKPLPLVTRKRDSVNNKQLSNGLIGKNERE